MTKKRRAAWYKLFSIMMVLSLLAGMIVPAAPAVVYAEGEDAFLASDLTTGVDDPLVDSPDSPLESTAESTVEDDAEQMNEDNAVSDEEASEESISKDDAEEDTVTNSVYGEETPDVVTSMGVGILSDPEPITVKVFGKGVENPQIFDLLEFIDEHPDAWVGPRVYSTINTWPTKKWYAAEGVKLTALLEEAGMKRDAQQIKVRASDGYVMTFTVKELLEDTRHYFPKLKENDEYAGHIPGSPEGAEPVETIIALRSVENSDNFNYMTSLACPLLVLGQRAVTEQTNHTFVKNVSEIEVLTEPPSKWAAPVANPPGGEVPVGTEVVLTNQFNDADKIYYTTDGSDPTLDSPIYNWVASRWWSSRLDVLDEINKPIVITGDTIIKAKTIGFGREDSDIATFEYTVPKVYVTGVSISEGDQELEVGGTVQLTAVVEPEDATDKSATWSSSNEAVATVDETGLVTAIAEGTTTITITTTDGGFTDSITVTVVPVVLEPLNPPALIADSTDNTVGNPIELTFVDDEDWRNAVNEVTVNGSAIASDDYTLAAGKLAIDASVFTAPGEYTIVVKATGYEDATVTQILTTSDFVVEDGVLVGYTGAGGDVVIPGDLGITSIGSMVFAYLDNLTSVVIPEGVTTIGGIAFEGCSNLTTVVLPESVNKIGAFAFAECPKLTQINIPEAITCIEKETFYRCYALTSIRLPSGITSIEEGAFQQCYNLSEVNIPDAVTSIGKNAFRRCEALTEIVIPGNVTSIGDSAFYRCANLTSLTIHSTEAVFGSGVFADCPKLTIYGYSGSTAQAYANENSIPFVALNGENIPLTIVVKEDGAEIRTISYNMADWETARQRYSARDSMPAYRLGAAEGVFLDDLLEDAEIDVSKITAFKFVSTDEYAMPISKSELLDVPRYYYPNIFGADQEEGAELVKPMLALKSYVGARGNSEPPSWDMIDDLNTIRLFVGQKNPEDINYGLFAKWICEIEVELETAVVPVTGVKITPEDDQELEIGDTVQLTAVVQPEDATDKSVTWSSDNEAVATVDETGLVTAVAAGTAMITVTTTDGGFTDSIEVTVVSAPVVFTVEINGEMIEAYTMADLKAMPATTKAYGSTGFYKRTGVDFIYLLESLDIDYLNWTVKLKYITGGSVTLDFSVVTEPLLCYEENGNPFPTNNPLRLCYGDGSNHNLLYNYVAGIDVIKPEFLTPPELIADSTDNTVGNPIELTFTDDEDWRNAVNEVTVNGSAIASDDYSLAAGKLTIDASVFAAAGEYTIVVKAAGYWDATVTQTLTTEGFPYIVSITGVDDVEVPIGTEEADAIAALASETTIMDSDGEIHTVTLDWTIAGYDGNTAGAYMATGTFNLPESVEQSDPPLDLEVQATINVIDLSSDFVIENGVLVEYKGAGGAVVIPGNLGINSIGSSAFSFDKNVISVSIPDGVTSIGGNAFYECSNLASVSLPDGLTVIDYNAFKGCSSLTSINIPDSVTKFGSSAFAGCRSLTSINIPESITKIENYLFDGCSSLTELAIPDGVTSIGSFAFQNCNSLAELAIPDNVTDIGGYAFYNCSSLTEMTITAGVTSIGQYAFAKCSGLTAVTVLNSIASIGNNAFADCPELTIIGYAGSTANRYADNNDIPFEAIEPTIRVTGIRINEGDQELAVRRTSQLTCTVEPENASNKAVTWSSSNEDIASVSETGLVTAKSEGEATITVTTVDGNFTDSITVTVVPPPEFVVENGRLIEYNGAGGDVIIPGDLGITFIGYAFRNSSTLTSLTIPEGVTQIVSNAFDGCSNLTQVSLPAGIETIENYTFNNCSSLLEITLPEGVTSIGQYAFGNCSSLATITLPHSLTTINSYAFRNCSSLTEVVFPEGVTTIGSAAFQNCSNLASATFLNSETTIQSWAFYGCNNLSTIYGYSGSTAEAYANKEGITFIEITPVVSVTAVKITPAGGRELKIGETVQLTAVVEPEDATDKSVTWSSSDEAVATVDETGLVTAVAEGEATITVTTVDGGFTDSINITVVSAVPDDFVVEDGVLVKYTGDGGDVVIPGNLGITAIGERVFFQNSDLTSVEIPEGVTSIGYAAFCYCSNLASVSFPDSLLEIGANAFLSCSGLTSINLPDGLTTIKYGAFKGCSGLTSVEIPDSVTEIEYSAFSNCSGLTSITLPEGITALSDYLLSGCSLTSYEIPETVTSIGRSVFENCSKLSSISIPDSVETIGSSAFASCTSLAEVYIPDSVTEIGNYAFRYCSGLTSIRLSESITSIGEWMFGGCSSLTTLVIPEGVTTVNRYAFVDCSGLSSISIPNSVEEIGVGAFQNCTSLTEVHIPDGVADIANYLFRNCSSLTSIEIPEGVTSIGRSAFENCSSLTSVTIPSSVTTFGDDVFKDTPNVTIYGYSGSAAEAYANDNSIPFEVLDAKPHIVSITPVDDVQVPYGTAEGDAIAALASGTTITDSDGVTHNVFLTWTIEDYDGNTPGAYTATGTFELPEGVEQSDPPMALQVTAMVTVDDAYNMLSVEAEPADLPIGDSFTVSVNVENIRDVQGYQVTLKYDPAYAEYKSHRVNFKPVTIDLETIKDGEITVGNFVLGDTPWEQDSGALVEVEFESRHPGTIEGGVYAFTFEEIEVVLEPRDSSEPAVRAKLDSPVVKYYEGSEVNIYAALELREDHGGISSTLQNGSAYEATTASDGSATFETVRPGEYSLTLEAGGYLKAVVEGVVVTFGEENQVGTAGTPVKLYAGDVNGDGKINIVDISLAANKYGRIGDFGWVIEDLNLDGKVDISDLTAIARNYDMTTANTTYNYKDEAPYWE